MPYRGSRVRLQACRKTFRVIEETLRERGVDAKLEKVSDPVRIARCQVLSVPSVAVDGKLVQGGAPSSETVRSWLAE